MVKVGGTNVEEGSGQNTYFLEALAKTQEKENHLATKSRSCWILEVHFTEFMMNNLPI